MSTMNKRSKNLFSRNHNIELGFEPRDSQCEIESRVRRSGNISRMSIDVGTCQKYNKIVEYKKYNH